MSILNTVKATIKNINEDTIKVDGKKKKSAETAERIRHVIIGNAKQVEKNKHIDSAVKDIENRLKEKMSEEVSLDERRLTSDEMKKREEVAKKLPEKDFKKRYGKDWMAVKMATATNIAKEEIELAELSPGTKIDYIKKASVDLRNTALQHGSIKKMNNRTKGIEMAANSLAKEEADLEEGIGKTLAAGALAAAIGATGSAAISKAFPDKPVTYQVAGNNVVTKKNPGNIVHTAKNKEDALKWATAKNESVDEGIFSGIGTVAKGAAKTVGNVAHDVANLPGDPEKLHPIAGISRHIDSIGKTVHTINRSFSSKPVSSGSLSTRANRVGGVHTGMTHRVAEDIELDEGRGRPSLDHVSKPNSKGGFDIFHKKDLKKIVHQVKTKEDAKNWIKNNNKNSKEGEDVATPEADKNIVNQMRKKPVADMHHLVFANGEKKDVHARHVNKALSMLANTPKPADREKLQNSLGHSHKRFMDTVTSGKAVVDAPSPKVSLGKIKAKSVVMEDDRVADKGSVKTIIKMINGQPKLVKYSPPRAEINVESVDCLNSLYNDLSEDNKEIFNSLIKTEKGIASLLDFAVEQGY